MTKQRLSKVLASFGIASRRACELLISSSKVSVNGVIQTKPEFHVDADLDHITVNGTRVKGVQKKLYFLLNKPRGVICTNEKKVEGSRVIDLFEKEHGRLFTAGRLDKATTGLIIVTNDGNFANKVIHPSSGIKKEYLAKVDQEITSSHLITIGNGTLVEGTFVKPVSVKKIRRGTLKIVVSEGKKHEVRDLLESAGLIVKELTRIRIGSLTLGNLEVGSYKSLTEKDRELLFT